ncbi:MAG: bifunctional phosphoribosylaminoimidazolecarboxamide formyltransferase/IMP cyclohydrolase, partial [Actinobacteria bacterium]|nr:bifunctional phosphoribosylaminoimidazolecarboxamide formyltransferase/IMP cyclohydrolase [Actinomycetota bacterium]
KTGLAELAGGLSAHGATLVSTGSTARHLREAGVGVTTVTEITGFPEILDGRVKTLHPAVHAGLLADRSKAPHVAALSEHGFAPIDLVVCNLYPFREAAADAGAEPGQVVEMIDVGGSAMIRAAAKNADGVAVVVEPRDYPGLLAELDEFGGVTAATRRALAAKAFSLTANYDAAIAAWLAGAEPFPAQYGPLYTKARDLRYGENPHQGAAWYAEAARPWGLASARQLAGKALSYNNLLDADAAWAVTREFSDPCVAIVKHTNPAGVAVAASLAEAYPCALAGDPVSAYGGIVAANRTVDGATAEQIVRVFTEVVVAPGFDDAALAVLRARPALRVLRLEHPDPPPGARVVRSVAGGLLVQEPDAAGEDAAAWTFPTRARPDDRLLDELVFAWRACRHAKSNAIVLARGRAVVGVGAGQMSRVDSVRLAVDKSGERSAGAVLASDAFFPFRDGPDAALDAGVAALVQPGGSVRDDEVVAACDERGVPMALTGRRHFRH